MDCIHMTVLWDVASRGLIKTDRRFRGTHCLYHQDDSKSSSNVGLRENPTLASKVV